MSNKTYLEGRQGFLMTIKANPLDPDIRAIFADFLDEHDQPEEADFFRSWTVEKHQAALAFLTEYARVIDEHEKMDWDSYEFDEVRLGPAARYRPFTMDSLLEACTRYLDEAEEFGLSMNYPDEVRERREQMWESFCIVTARLPGSSPPGRSPFYCAC